MIKVLEYIPINALCPRGGPVGYLYNLNEGLKNLGNKDGVEISFLPVDNNFARKRKATSIKWLNDFIKSIYHKKYYKSLLRENGKHLNNNIDLNDYDIIHFHDVTSMFAIRDSLCSYNGKTCLTSHSPVPYFEEIKDRMTNQEKRIFGSVIKSIETIDKWAFSNADYIIFPCEYAMEPYFKHWPIFEQIISNKDIRFVPSGTRECKAKVSKSEVRKMYNIPDDAFVMCYAGRHSEVKGYLDLKAVGSEILKNENTWMLVAGKEAPLKGLNHPRWIEVGWTDDPHSLMAASDLFILPNKETYFDLVLLEVISLGAPALVSNTGGNKYFANKTTGIILFDGLQDAIDKVHSFMNLSKETIRDMKSANKALFKKEFDVNTFAKNYTTLYKDIFNE